MRVGGGHWGLDMARWVKPCLLPPPKQSIAEDKCKNNYLEMRKFTRGMNSEQMILDVMREEL